MEQFFGIFHYNLRQLYKNKWFIFGAIFSIGFYLVYSLDSLRVSRTPPGVVADYFQQNLIMPFFLLLITIITFHALKKQRLSNLIDSYPVSNYRFYFPTYLSIYLVFFILETLQFTLIIILRFALTGEVYLSSYKYFLLYALPNTLFYTSLGAFLVIIFRGLIPAAVFAFLTEMFIRMRYLDSLRGYLGTNLLNCYIFNRYNFSEFTILAQGKELVLLNRLFFITIGIVLCFVGFLLFKPYREKGKKMVPGLIVIGGVIVGSCLFIYYTSLQNIPVEKDKIRISNQFNGSSELKTGEYHLEGRISKGKFQATADFQLINTGSTPQPVILYLANGFQIQQLWLDGREWKFKRRGEKIVVEEISLPAQKTVKCMVSYESVVSPYSEYAKVSDRPLAFIYNPVLYMDEDFLFFPSGSGWYPTTKPLYRLMQDRQWVIPLSDRRIQGFHANIEADIPVFNQERFMIAHRDLTIETYDGINYVFLKAHRPLIKRLHTQIKDEVLFFNDLIPLPEINVVEIPQNIFYSGAKRYIETERENGGGLILVNEETVFNITYCSGGAENQAWSLSLLEDSIASGWFPPPDNIPATRITVDRDRAFVLRTFMEYLYKLTRSEAEVKDFLKRNPFLDEKMVDFYQEYGLERTKELLRNFYQRERERGLEQKDFQELLKTS